MARPKLPKEEYDRRRREYRKKYFEDNPDVKKKSYEKNKEKQKKKDKQKYLDNREARIKYISEYQKQYRKQRYHTDELYKLTDNIRCAIWGAFKKQDYTKRSRTLDILGCTWDEFKQHLESQFEPWMNWDNRGSWGVSGPNMTWDIDHIIPISSATSEEEILKLSHYTNFQPLCSYYNRYIKRDKI